MGKRMRLKAYRQLGDPNPRVFDTGMIVIEKDDGTPIGVACEDGGGFIHIAHAGERRKTCKCQAGPMGEEFQEILRNLGIDKLVVVEDMAEILNLQVQEGLPPSAKMPLLDI